MYNKNWTFYGDHLLQINGTATGATNSCSYYGLAIYSIDKSVMKVKESNFIELQYFEVTALDYRMALSPDFLNRLHTKLQFTNEVGGDNISFLDLKNTLRHYIHIQ